MSEHEREQEIGVELAERAFAYGVLHVVFGGEPTADIVQTSVAAETRELLARLANVDAYACSDVPSDLGEAFSLLERAAARVDDAAYLDELQSSYTRLFITPGASFVRPWESPYVGKEVMLFQESTLDVRRRYHEAGFKLQAEKRFPDDHIGALMDFQNRLAQRVYDAFADGDDARACALLEEQASFNEDHVLTWIDAFAEEVVAHDDLGFYRAFAQIIAAFARTDTARARALARELA